MALFWSSLLTFYTRRENGLLHVTDKAAILQLRALNCTLDLNECEAEGTRKPPLFSYVDYVWKIIILVSLRQQDLDKKAEIL